MDFVTKEIIDVFHDYAFTNRPDTYSRRHIHGLSNDFLEAKGHANPFELITAFKRWLAPKSHILLYANNPKKEMDELRAYICDIGLDGWTNRITKTYHVIANTFKKHFIPICSKRCSPEAHSSFVGTLMRPNNSSDAAKEQHGFHCSLYDAYELYLFYVTSE